MDNKDLNYTIIILLIIVLVVLFNKQICSWLSNMKESMKKSVDTMPDSSEDMENQPEQNQTPSDTLQALGYEDSLPWNEVIKTSEVDPSVHASHADFVKDVRILSSGANFTSVADDNTNLAFTDFRGLRRPQAHPGMIGKGARQVPDIEEDVLTRNKGLYF